MSGVVDGGGGPGGPDDEGDEDRAALAGEYVLGLLPQEERAWVERELAADPVLAAQVLFWQDRLLPLDEALPPESPAPELWARIEAGIWPAAAAAAVAAPAAALDRPRAVPQAARAAVPPPRPPAPRPGLLERLDRGLWQSLGFWRLTGMAAAAAALALALLPGAPPAGLPVPTAITVLLGSDDKVPGWLVQAYPDATFQVLPLGEAAIPADRALELWTRPAAGDPLRSIGVLPPAGRPAFTIAGLAAVARGQLFAISLEPMAGSPTGQPTGPVLFAGEASPVPLAERGL